MSPFVNTFSLKIHERNVSTFGLAIAEAGVAMEILINLASLTLEFLLRAFVITAVVSLGSMVLARKPMHFWPMFRVTCVILLIVNLVVLPLLEGSSE